MSNGEVRANYVNANDVYSAKKTSYTQEYRQILEKKLDEQAEVIRDGGINPSFQMGGDSYTTEEWEELLANFDATMDDMREQMRAEHERRYKEQLEKIAEAKTEIENAKEISGVDGTGIFATDTYYTEFSTSKYDVVPNDEYSCFEVYSKAGEKMGNFSYSDIRIRTDAATGTQLLISEHGTASYTAMVLDYELISGFQQSMGQEALPEESLEGFALHTHAETGIRYLIKEGDEGRGGNLLISNEAERVAFDKLAQTYLTEYPNLVSNNATAQINATLEILGLLKRTPNGILSINKDGMSYNDNSDFKKNWALMFQGDYYETVFEFVKMHSILGTDLSDYKLWDEFFTENEIQIERIWSDQEIEQGYLNN